MPWMSSELMPWPTFFQVRPRSVERCTPSISTPAQIVSLSIGSNRICVTRGLPTKMQASANEPLAGLKLLPPSVETKMPAGCVPTTMVSGSSGACAIDQMS